MAGNPIQTMKPTTILAALGALGVSIALTTPLMASEPADHTPPSRSTLYKALDADEDGTLSSGEIDGSTAALRALDENSDGSLTRNELLTAPPPAAPAEDSAGDAGSLPPTEAYGDTGEIPRQGEPEGPPKLHRPRVSPLMAALDLNHDGTLSSEELEEAVQAAYLRDYMQFGFGPWRAG